MAVTTLSDFSGNTTLVAGTYWMPYDINCNGYTLTFDCSSGPIIIKRAGDYCFNYLSTVNTTNSTATNKVYWTDKNDDTIGETISGSTGTPVKSGLQLQNIATVADGYTFKSAITIINHEIRYADNKQFIWTEGTPAKTFQYVTWKNSDYSSVNVIQQTATVSLSTNYFQYINFDSTNTLTGTSRLCYNLAKTYVDYIFVENANTTNPVINWGNSTYGAATTIFTYIRIKNAGGFGIGISDIRSSTVYLKHSCVNHYIENMGGSSALWQFENCLFDATLTGYSAYALSRIDANYDIYWTAINCVFKGYTKVFWNREYGGNRETYITATNCIFDSNTQLLTYDDLGHQTANYCGYYNNGETYWARGANDFTANPSFGNILNGTIDTTFDDYIPNGYMPSPTDYQNKGSDTWDNLSIDETLYSPDGLRHKGTAKIWPGIYYLMTTFGGQADVTATLTLPKITLAATGTVTAAGETGTAELTLPKITLSSTGNKLVTGTSTLTLPLITLASEGYLTHFATSTLTLPIITLNSTGSKVNSGTSIITLPQITLAATGYFISGVSTLTLPIVAVSAIAYKTDIFGTAELTLPKTTLTGVGAIYHEATSALILPALLLTCSGVHYSLASAALTLPVPTLQATAYKTDIVGTADLTLPQLTFAAQGYLTHFATSTLVLPKVTLASTGYLTHFATSALTLPQITLASTGYLTHFVTSTLTLPLITFSCTGQASQEVGTGSLTLPIITLACIAKKVNQGSATVLLPQLTITTSGTVAHVGICNLIIPQITLSSTGYLTHFATSIIVLPKLTLASNGYLTHFGTASITLTQITLNASGHRIKIVSAIALILPATVAISSVSWSLPAGVEVIAYNELVKVLQNQLSSYVSTWYLDSKPRILRQGDYPSIQIIDKGIIKERFIAYPRRKLTTLSVQIIVKVWNSDQEQLERNRLKLQEQVKDALESHIQLNGKCNNMYINEAVHKQLYNNCVSSKIDLEIDTIKFATESRQ